LSTFGKKACRNSEYLYQLSFYQSLESKTGCKTFTVPQVRDGGFYPSALEKGLRSERALTITLAEMYVQRVSTRKVKAITEQLCGVEVSANQVSRAAAQLDEILQEWRERPLGEITPLFSCVSKMRVMSLTGVDFTSDSRTMFTRDDRPVFTHDKNLASNPTIRSFL